MPAFDPATLDRWRTLAIVDRDGTTVGTVSEFYLDRETGHPTWALVNTGLFGVTKTFVPLVHATEITDGLQVPYEKSHIKDAPRVDLHDELSPDEEAALFTHYGVDYQPSNEPTPPEPGLADPTDPEAAGSNLAEPGRETPGAGSDLAHPTPDPGREDVGSSRSDLDQPTPDPGRALAEGGGSDPDQPTHDPGRDGPFGVDPELSRPAPVEPGLPGSIPGSGATPATTDPRVGTSTQADDTGSPPPVDDTGSPARPVDDAGSPPPVDEAGSPPGGEADQSPPGSRGLAPGDPSLAATGPGPVPATDDEPARTAEAPPRSPAEPFATDREGRWADRLDEERPGADPARTSDAADRSPRPPGEPGWAPGEAGGFEGQEPAARPASANDLQFHEADVDQGEPTSTPPEERSPLERARRRLERLVSGGQAPNDPSPSTRDAPERARRQRFGLNEPDDPNDR